MMQFELIDGLLFVNGLNNPTNAFNIYEYVTFSSHTTRCTSNSALKLPLPKQIRKSHSYFNRLPRLWNSLPFIDLRKWHCLHSLEKWLRQHSDSYTAVQITVQGCSVSLPRYVHSNFCLTNITWCGLLHRNIIHLAHARPTMSSILRVIHEG